MGEPAANVAYGRSGLLHLGFRALDEYAVRNHIACRAIARRRHRAVSDCLEGSYIYAFQLALALTSSAGVAEPTCFLFTCMGRTFLLSGAPRRLAACRR